MSVLLAEHRELGDGLDPLGARAAVGNEVRHLAGQLEGLAGGLPDDLWWRERAIEARVDLARNLLESVAEDLSPRRVGGG